MLILFDLRKKHVGSVYHEFAIEFFEQLMLANPQHIFHYITDYDIIIDTATYSKLGKFSSLKKENKEVKNIIAVQKPAFSVFFSYENTPSKLENDYYIVHSDIKKVVFHKMGFLDKYILGGMTTIKNKLSNAQKNLCFESMTVREINERLDVTEFLIDILPPFFPKKAINNDYDKQVYELDIKARHNISGEYFIYDTSNNNESNLEKLLDIFIIFKQLGLDYNLLILSNGADSDVFLREKILQKDLNEYVYFIGMVKETEQYFYYSQALAALYPSIYESFNFDLTKSIKYNTPVIMHKSKSNSELYSTSFHYTNFLAPNLAADRIIQFIKSGENKRDYGELLEKRNVKDTIRVFSEITKLHDDTLNKA